LNNLQATQKTVCLSRLLKPILSR